MSAVVLLNIYHVINFQYWNWSSLNTITKTEIFFKLLSGEIVYACICGLIFKFVLFLFLYFCPFKSFFFFFTRWDEPQHESVPLWGWDDSHSGDLTNIVKQTGTSHFFKDSWTWTVEESKMALTGMSSDFDLDDHGILRDSFACESTLHIICILWIKYLISGDVSDCALVCLVSDLSVSMSVVTVSVCLSLFLSFFC